MGLDKESIEKRVSRIELDIDHMNQMIDENLKLNEAGDRLGQDAKEHHVEDKLLLNNEGTHQEELPRDDSIQHSVTSAYSEQDGNVSNGSISRENSVQKSSEAGSFGYGSPETPHESQEAPVARSEASNDEYYDWSEEQQEQDEQAYATGQSEADTEDDYGQDGDGDPEETFQAPEEDELQENASGDVHLHKRQNSEQHPEANDEWEDEVDEPEPRNENENENENEDKFPPESTPDATPQKSHVATLPEQNTPRTINYETQPETQPDIQQKEQETKPEAPITHFRPQDNDSHQHTYETEQNKEVPNPPRGIESVEAHEDESLEYSYEPAHQNLPDAHKKTIGSTPSAEDNSNNDAPPDTKQTVMSQDTLDEKFSDSLYDTYGDQAGLPSRQESDAPQESSSVGSYRINTQQNDPYDDYSYETFETSEPAPPHTANTSRDSSSSTGSPFINDKPCERSTSGSTGTDDSIHIPKNSAQRPATTSNTPITSRRPTNPFRVVSVGVVGPDGRTSRKTSAGTFSSHKDVHTDGAAILQKKLDHLVKKCTKLQREIDYLNKMNSASSLPIEDSRKLSRAVDKLQEYLDKKNKEKYDVGVLLSRQLRREIDRGENGQFWVGTK